MILRNVFLPVFILALSFWCFGCRRDSEQPLETELSEVVVPPLTDAERVVKDAINDVFLRRHSRWPSNSTSDVKKEVAAILLSVPDDIDRKKIFRQFRKDIVAMPIRRCTNEVPQGATWRASLNDFLDYAYGSISLNELMAGPHVEFEDIVFDLQITRRLAKELSQPSSPSDGRGGGWTINNPLDSWVRGAFYCEGSDFNVYWMRASPGERKRIMEWFIKNGGRIPDWAR